MTQPNPIWIELNVQANWVSATSVGSSLRFTLFTYSIDMFERRIEDEI
jgi:hypothetical protein